MSRFIYLIRHARTRPRAGFPSDKARTLNEEGEREALEVGAKLKSDNAVINRVITSPAARARSTALLLAKQLDFDISQIQEEAIIYSGHHDEIIKVLTSIPDSVAGLLLVGHYPTIIDLHNHLSSNKRISIMATAEVCVLKFETTWRELSEAICIHEYNYYPGQPKP